jgi:hypothetical protein
MLTIISIKIFYIESKLNAYYLFDKNLLSSRVLSKVKVRFGALTAVCMKIIVF